MRFALGFLLIAFSLFAGAKVPLLDGLIGRNEKPRRVVIVTNSQFLGDDMMSAMPLIPLFRQKFGPDCEIVFISPWAQILRPLDKFLPVKIERNYWNLPGASGIIRSYVSSRTDLVFAIFMSSVWDRTLLFNSYEQKFLDALDEIEARKVYITRQQMAAWSEDLTPSKTAAILERSHRLVPFPEPDATNYEVMLRTFRTWFSPDVSERDIDLRDYLEAPTGEDEFYSADFGGLALSKGEPFVLVNLNAGIDKIRSLEDYNGILWEIVHLIRSQNPNLKILLTSPQSPAEVFPAELIKNIWRYVNDSYRSLDDPRGLRFVRLIKAKYSRQLTKVSAALANQDSHFLPIGIIDHRNSSHLSRAIINAQFIVSQDTGLPHVAYQRRNLHLPGSRPEVVSLSFGHGRKWSLKSQPFIPDIKFRPRLQRFDESTRRAISESLREVPRAEVVIIPLVKERFESRCEP